MAKNEMYSFKDFTGQSFKNRPAGEFNNSEIIGSCFYQKGAPDTDIFPDGMTGVTFKRCNLDNVLIPANNAITSDAGIASTQKRIIEQNDLEDWEVDGQNVPREPINKKWYLRLGLSIDPNDIPAEPLARPITETKELEIKSMLEV
jgi:hypothetical protein